MDVQEDGQQAGQRVAHEGELEEVGAGEQRHDLVLLVVKVQEPAGRGEEVGVEDRYALLLGR